MNIEIVSKEAERLYGQHSHISDRLPDLENDRKETQRKLDNAQRGLANTELPLYKGWIKEHSTHLYGGVLPDLKRYRKLEKDNGIAAVAHFEANIDAYLQMAVDEDRDRFPDQPANFSGDVAVSVVPGEKPVPVSAEQK